MGRMFLIFVLLMLVCGSVVAVDESDTSDELVQDDGSESAFAISVPIVSPAPLQPRDTGVGVVSY